MAKHPSTSNTSTFPRGRHDGTTVRTFIRKPVNGADIAREKEIARRAFEDTTVDADAYLAGIFATIIHDDIKVPLTQVGLQRCARELIEAIHELGHFSLPFREAEIIQSSLRQYETMVRRIELSIFDTRKPHRHKQPPYGDAFVTAARSTLGELHSQLNNIQRESREALREHASSERGNGKDTLHKPSSQIDLSPGSALHTCLLELEEMTRPHFEPKPGIRIGQNGRTRHNTQPYRSTPQVESIRIIA